jgi:GGDEF domain-containing protein
MEPAELLKNADVAMYRAKQAGRKQFKFFSEPLMPA